MYKTKINGVLSMTVMAIIANIIFALNDTSPMQLFYGRLIKKESILQTVNKKGYLAKNIKLGEVRSNLRNLSQTIVEKAVNLKTLVHDEAVTVLGDIKKFNENMYKLYRCRKAFRSEVIVMLKEFNDNGEPRYVELLEYMLPVQVDGGYSDILAQSMNLTALEIRKLVKLLEKSIYFQKKLNTITKHRL